MLALLSPVLQPGWLKLQLRGLCCHPGAAPGCQGWHTLPAGAANTRTPITGVLGEAVRHKIILGVLRQSQHQGSLNSRALQVRDLPKWFVDSRKLRSVPFTAWCKGRISHPMKTSLTQTPVWHLKILYLCFSITYVGIQAWSQANYRVLNYKWAHFAMLLCHNTKKNC